MLIDACCCFFPTRDATAGGPDGAEINLLCYFISTELHTRGNKSSLGGLMPTASFVCLDGSPRHVGGRTSVADW